MKPFYIESDEEITSVIDRLRASTQEKNIFVVPAGAMILQSAVNMRLLLREAKKAQKQLVVVTSDEYGQTLAEKVGIETYASLEEIDGVEHDDAENLSEENVATIGSSSYYESPQASVREHDVNLEIESPESALSQDAHTVQDVAAQSASIERAVRDFESMQKQNVIQSDAQGSPAMDMRPASVAQPKSVQTMQQLRARNSEGVDNTQHASEGVRHQGVAPSEMDEHKQKEVQAFFGRHNNATAQASNTTYSPASSVFARKDKKLPAQVSSYAHVPENMLVKESSTKKMVAFFAIGGLLASAVIVFFVFFPRVTIALKPTVREKSATINVTADATQATTAFDEKKIGLILLEKDIEKTLNFESTGTSTESNYKARGSVTIYNNYSTSPQKLVATTRLLTKDGILFRLVEGVTVPGMTTKDGVTVPGSVRADVIADKAGEESNIGPSEFTIPGFKGSPRYGKFFAKSEGQMAGGSVEGGTRNVITKDDLDRAKKSAEEEVVKIAKEQIMLDASEQGKKALDDAISTEIVFSGAQITAGVAAESFDYTVHVRAKGLVFSEEDITIMLKRALSQDIDKDKMTMKDLKLTYSPSLANFEKQLLELKVRGTARLVPNIDTESVRNAIAGKKKEDIDSVLSSFDGIEQAELRYNAGFLMGRLPWYKGSITVIVEE